MNELSEIRLVEEIVSGSKPAFDKLFLSYYSRLCAFAATIVKRDELAEEAVSEVFFNIWKSRETLEIHTSVKAYLFTSVRNQALAVMKREANDVIYSEQDDMRIDDEDPQLLVEFNELTASVDQAITTLPPKCKQIFILSRFEGLKYKQIAELLNVSEKTVENQLVKALVVLRNKLLSKTTKSFTSR